MTTLIGRRGVLLAGIACLATGCSGGAANAPVDAAAARDALTAALDAVATYERLGSPEGELALAQAVIYLACAPKSNAVYTAFNTAKRFISEDGSRPVPVHLRNAPTKLMKELGFGRAYRYAHDEPEAYAAGEHYFPDEIESAPRFYQPTPRGLEGKICERLEHLHDLDLSARKKRGK